MSPRPVIFISAVSKELHSTRDLVAKVLLSLGYEPVWQDLFGMEEGTVKEMLHRKIAAAQGLIQLVGHYYGAEPAIAAPPFGRVSYTQYEALHARQQGKRVWYLLLEENYSADAHEPESAEHRQLQSAYRQRIQADDHLYHPLSSRSDIELRLFKLRDELVLLRRRSQQWAVLVIGLLALLIVGGFYLARGQQQIHTVVAESDQKVDVLLQALRDLPQTLNQQPRSDAPDDEATRIARAYAVLETQLHLQPGSLAQELPKFAQQLLQRADTSVIDRANALFATQKFAEAEAEALKAKDQALSAAGQPVQDAIAALRLAGQSAEAQIHYPQAMDHYRAATALTSKERDVLQWLDLQNDISWLYYLQGRYPERLTHAKAVWQAAQQAGHDEAQAVLTAHMQYASALDDNGKYAEAEVKHRAIIQVQERVLGAEHRDTLASRNNLATALYAQAKYAEAEQEHRARIKIEERVLGAEHPDTLSSRNNLALTLSSQSKYVEAEQELRAVLKILERVLGAEHPNTLTSRMSLAFTLNAHGNHAEAEQEHRAVLKVQERVLGAEHPKTLGSRNNLALALYSQAKYAEAEQEHRAVLKGRERVLGAEHPETLGSQNNLGNVLRTQGKHAEAEQEHRAVLKVRERVLGAEHPKTLSSHVGLGYTLNAAGKHQDAEKEYRQVLPVMVRILGARHPDVLNCRNNLAEAVQEQGKWAEMEPEHRELLTLREEVLGSSHSHVLESCYNLALCLEHQDQFKEALPLAQRAETGRNKLFGTDSTDSKKAQQLRERLEAAVKEK